MLTAPLFDPSATDDDIRLWNGQTTNLMLLDRPNMGWALQIYNQMRECFWVPQKTDLTVDQRNYLDLQHNEKRAYNGVLSYLIFLDSVQEYFLPQIGTTMTAPAVRHTIATQAFYEGIHSESYKYVVESLHPVETRNEIYDFWRTDSILKERCNHIISYYQAYLDSRKDEDYFYALFADYLLEGLYFYNGFQMFYVLATRHLMGGTADIIKLIHRDERIHVLLFQKLLVEGMKEFNYSEDKLYEMTSSAVEQEIKWANHIIGQEFLGITETSIEQYTKYLADLRLRAIGLNSLYDAKKNPYKHLERVADVSDQAGTKSNFFEVTVSSYQMSSVVKDWDF